MTLFITKVFNKIGILKCFNFIVKKQIRGRAIKIPVAGKMGFENLRLTEMWMCEIIENIAAVRKGVLIDVGVNMGQTLLKAKIVDSDMKYIGFEPNPICVYYSNSLIKLNNFNNCRLLPVGLFDRDTVLQLNLFSTSDTDCSASLISDLRPDQKIFNKLFVPVADFNTLYPSLEVDNILLIKIDVEGAELEVLKSMKGVIVKERPPVLIEILPCYDEMHTDRIRRQQEIEALLSGLNYKIFRILKKNNESVESLQPLETIGIHSKMELCDYLFVPEEMNISNFKF